MQDLSGSAIKGYELRERIGAGGFGAVYKAYQSTVGREVAVKIILPHFASHPDFIRRFETEAQLIARLEHPYIIPLYDYWRDPNGAYLVMRWLRGGSLRDALQNGPFEPEAAALLIDQIAAALVAAHRNNIIHRDLKPGNILLDEDGNAYLADFGIAKDLDTKQPSTTEMDAIIGSPDYLAPEQARSEAVTPRTDLYSLGVVLYEILTGEHPFPHLTPVERLYKHLNDPLPRIEALTDEICEGVNAVIQKATAKNPAHRYMDSAEMAAAFRKAVSISQNESQLVQTLTLREQDILQRIIAGQSNRQIASELFMTVGTVKWYITQIYRKLGVRSRVQAMVRARDLNLISGKIDEASSLIVIPTDDFQPENPYKGLRAFQSADHQDFFGREKVTKKLIKRAGETGDFTRFLAVVGPSGSGKSSLVKAGLIPALWRGEVPGSEKWFVVEMLPGARPVDELEIALTRVAANQSGSLNEQLRRDQYGLLRAASLILPNDGSDLLLVIDQFEEVFTLVEDEAARVHFLNLLYAAVTEPRSRVRVVVTLRADFYDRPLHYPDFGELMRSRLETVLPLSAEELERAIARPAERVGATFEPGLIASIVADVNYQPGALPLLQYALTELFEQRKGRVLTREAYQAIGGTVGALAKRADELYLSVDETAQEIIRQMFLRLVTLGEGTEDTRRRVARSELLAISVAPDLMDEIVDTYTEYRLLALDNDPGTRAPTVEVAHEALLREWDRLRAWLNESRDEIKLQRQLAAMASEWRGSKQDNSFLARGSRLEQFENWAKDTQLALTAAEHAYLDASIAQRAKEAKAETERQTREKALEKRSVTFLRGLVAVMFMALIGAFGLIGVAVNQSQIAERSAAEAQNVALISGSQAALANDNTDLAVALAMQAVTLDPSSARAQVALSEAAYAPGTIRVFEGHTAEVDWVEFSPDGLTALSASWDGTLILWDVQTGAEIRRFEGHTDKTDTVAFTPDGLSAISGSYDTTMIQWDIQTGEMIRRFEGQPDQIWALAISPDSLTVASGGSGNDMLLWDLQTGEILRRFEGHTAGIESIAFSADGSKLLTASDDYSVILWDVATGQILHRLVGHFSIVYSAIFSPDNSMILSGSDNSNMLLWDIESGQIIRTYYGDGPTIFDVAFSPDGRSVLSAGIAGIILWNTQTAQRINPLRGHQGFVKSIVFSPDGRTALSAADDSTLRLWNLESGQIIRHFNLAGMGWWGLAASPDGSRALALLGDGPQTYIVLWDVNTGEELQRVATDEDIYTTAFSPDGQTALLAINHYDGTPSDIILWDVNTGAEIRRFSGHPADIGSVAFSPDGRRAASVGWQNTIILWDVATGAEIRRFEGYAGDGASDAWVWINDLAFSPDGQALITAHYDATIILWDVATGTEIRRFEGHSQSFSNIEFSGDGQQAFSGSADGTTILWDVASGSILRRFTDHSGSIAGADITADGHFGIAGSIDNTTMLWDLNTGRVIRLYDTAPFTILFTPDNRTSVVGIYPPSIELWRIDATLEELLTWTRANRYIPELTCDQRALYRLEPLCAEDPAP